MTQLLETALAKVRQLTPPEQDAIAQQILDELADEQQWDEAFARSQDALGRLAAKVREDITTGKTRRVGMDDL